MEINVIIPVKNRPEMLIRTLDTVAGQTRRPDRLIIVDNGSSDATPEKAADWIAGHPEINASLISEPKPGAAAARNRGLKEIPDSDETYVMYFDSDDLMLPRHIERIEKALEMYPGTDLLYFDLAIRDNDGWTQVKSVAGDAPLIREQIFHSALSTQRFIATVSLLRRAGGWDEDLTYWDDYELGIRLAVNAESPRKLTGEPTVVAISHPDSITGTSYSASAPMAIRALNSMRRTLAAAELRQDLRYLAARRAIVAALFAREGAREIAESTLDDALKAVVPRDTIALHLAYFVTRITGHGGAFIASWLLAPPRPKKHTRLSRN